MMGEKLRHLFGNERSVRHWFQTGIRFVERDVLADAGDDVLQFAPLGRVIVIVIAISGTPRFYRPAPGPEPAFVVPCRCNTTPSQTRSVRPF
jgi:hypothetical protein